MGKGKAIFITTIVMALLGGMIYLFWEYSIRSYYVAVQLIAMYGFVAGALHMVRWLSKEPVKYDPYWDGENRE